MPSKPYRKRLQSWYARRHRAATLKKRGYSLAEIGKMLHPQVSKQAVAKLIAKAEAEGAE